MILSFDIGNTDIHGGVFEGESLVLDFRMNNQHRPSVDEIGVFLRQLLLTHGLEPTRIVDGAIASVVPDSLPRVREACRKYLGFNPLVLEVGTELGVELRVDEPRSVGADRVANALAAHRLYPGRNCLVIDMGTATTIDVVAKEGAFLGGVILAGMGLVMSALGQKTAQLPLVDIVRPAQALGKTTATNIQSGLYYGQLGQLKELCARLAQEAFPDDPPLIIATGGVSRLFAEEGLFDGINPGLVLQGLRFALKLNR